MRGLWMVGLAPLLAACSVDTDGFSGVMSGSASASASTGGSADDSSGGDVTGGSGSGGTQSAGPGSDSSEGSASDPSTAETGASAGSSDGGDSGTTTGAGTCTGMPLDAQLDVPPLCAPTCNNIGFGSDCAGIEICRLKDTQTAVCESCEPCGNLHAPCNATDECDILFTCFMGQCTAMCDLTTPQTCGNPAACTNVGHATHGVCDPNL